MRWIQPLLLLGVLGLWTVPAGHAYIANPPLTLGHMANASDYIMLARVESVDRDKKVIVYRKVRDIKGKWPADIARHVINANPIARAVAPFDEKEATYVLKWADKDKTAILFARNIQGNSPDRAMSHAYIDHCWYSTRTRDQDIWHTFSMEPNFLRSVCAGKPEHLAVALDKMLADKEAIVPIMTQGKTDDLRQGRAKIQGLRVGLKILTFNPKKDTVGWNADDK
jgi:hypothetical protein